MSIKYLDSAGIKWIQENTTVLFTPYHCHFSSSVTFILLIIIHHGIFTIHASTNMCAFVLSRTQICSCMRYIPVKNSVQVSLLSNEFGGCRHCPSSGHVLLGSASLCLLPVPVTTRWQQNGLCQGEVTLSLVGGSFCGSGIFFLPQHLIASSIDSGCSFDTIQVAKKLLKNILAGPAYIVIHTKQDECILK